MYSCNLLGPKENAINRQYVNVFGDELSEDSFEIEKRKKGSSESESEPEESEEEQSVEVDFVLPGDPRGENISEESFDYEDEDN